MKTQYYTATSLDGFLATEDDSLEWLDTLGEGNESSYPTFIRDIGAIAMGSGTYRWLLRNAFGPEAPKPEPWPYKVPTWIFTSRDLPRVPNADLRFAKGDVRPVHAEMRAAVGDRNIWLAGGGDLVGQFHDAGLLDEIIVQVASATLGRGKPLLPRRITGNASFRLVSVERLGPGLAELRYEVPRAVRPAADASHRGA